MKEKSHYIPEDKPKKVAILKILSTSTILALMITVPSISVALIMHYILRLSITMTGITSLIILFVAMGLGYKFSKIVKNIANN